MALQANARDISQACAGYLRRRATAEWNSLTYMMNTVPGLQNFEYTDVLATVRFMTGFRGGQACRRYRVYYVWAWTFTFDDNQDYVWDDDSNDWAWHWELVDHQISMHPSFQVNRHGH